MLGCYRIPKNHPTLQSPNLTMMIYYRRRRRRRRHRNSPVEALPDDLLLEILLRLTPHPSSLPRVSLVSKRWQRLITNNNFIGRFHAHHRTPPLLGYFAFLGRFYPTQEPPCRTPPTLTSLNPLIRERDVYWWGLLDCRHGLVLTGATRLLEFKFVITEFTVFDPMIGGSGYKVTTERQPGKLISAAVVAGAGGTDRSSFRVVALFSTYGESRVTASVFSSDSGVWVNSATLLVPSSPIAFIRHPSTLVGNSINWLPDGVKIIQFNLETQCLAFMEQPPHVDVQVRSSRWIIPTEDGHLGLAILSERRIQFWERDIELSVATWKLCKTVELDNVIPLELKEQMSSLRLIGFAEENNVIFICAHDDDVFMSHIKSMQFRKVHTNSNISNYIHPFSSF